MATTKKSTPKRSEAELQRDIYSPLVTKLDDNHVLKTNVELVKSKENLNAKPDYIMQINGNWTPLEVFSTAINENTREPLERICKYAHNSSFRDQSHVVDKEKEPTPITTPHGFVLIGDAQTIYLGYASTADIGVNKELKAESHTHGFVYQNDKPVSWHVSPLSDALIQDMRNTVQEYIAASQKSPATLTIKDTLPPPTNYTQLRHQLRNTRITSQKSLTENQLQELLYNPVVKEIDDKHELKTNIELPKSTANLNAKPDYIMQINGNWTPLEVFATAINENTRVPLERICKYAYNSSFRDQSHVVDKEKESTAITPPHGFVLIGDAQTIYLGYASTADIGVNKELKAESHTHGFVYQNDKPVSWQVSALSDAMIQDMRNTVQEYIVRSQKSDDKLTLKDTLPAPINYTQIRQQLRNTRITSQKSLTENQLQELLYNPVVTQLDDNNELKTNIVLIKSKANLNAEPDYIMQINSNWTPLEVFATAINENTRVPLERICKYAHNSSFRDQSHADDNKTEPTAITPPHGFVLIGDAQTIYLGYASTADIGVNKELKAESHTHGFVYQNDKPVSWHVSALTDTMIQDIRKTVQEYIAPSKKSAATLTIKDTLPPPINYTQIRKQLRNTRITSQKSLTENQLQELLYNPVVTQLDDNNELKTNIVLIKSKANLNAEPDYIMQINGNWTPLEVFSTAINENTRVPLERICKYAHNSSFRDQSHADDNKTEPTAITPPHGFVLIGDAQTIYLGYASTADIGVNKELKAESHTHGFVYQNDKPVSWQVSALSDAMIQDMRNTVQEYIVRSQKSDDKLTLKDTLPAPIDIVAALQPLRPYVGGNADLMNNVASLADEIKGLAKTNSPISDLCLCTPVGDNIYFTRIDDVWFPVHINYAGTPTAIDYKKYTYVEEFKVPSAIIPIIPIEQPHGISLVASLQGIDIMYTDENGKTTKSLKKIAINTKSTLARQTILECYSDHE